MTQDFTPIEQRLFDYLSDEKLHPTHDCLVAATGNKFASPSLLPTHVWRLRKKLVGCKIKGSARGYRLVRDEVDA